MKLVQNIKSEKPFIEKFNKTKQRVHLRKLIKTATGKQIRILASIVAGHFDGLQKMGISKRAFKKLELSRKTKFIEKNFGPFMSLKDVEGVRKLLLKIVGCLKIFSVNVCPL